MNLSETLRRNPSVAWRFTVAVALLAVTLWIGLRMDPAQAGSFVREYGYFFTFVGFGLFIGYLAAWWFVSIRKFNPKCVLFALVTVGASSTVVFHGSELDYKILMDDYLLAATAKSLHESGEVAVADFGREIDGEFRVIQSFVDKRPWFYPFLVSLVHDTMGYDPVHPFLVNAAITVAFLIVVFAIGYALGGYPGGIVSVLLWATLPLLQQNATGGGMEMLNLLLIHVAILLSGKYLRSPSALGEGALCLTGVLLTYSRYESGLFIAAILLVIVLGWHRKQQVYLSLPAMCAAPLLLAAFLQTRIYAATEASWELPPGATAPFSLEFLWANLPHAFAFFWSRDPAIANSLLLGILALPAVLGFIILTMRRLWARPLFEWRERGADQAWVLFALFLLLSLLIVLCFHAAQFDKRYVARYSLPAHGLIVFCSVSCLAALRPPRLRRLFWAASFILIVGFILTVTLPKNGQALYSKANFMIAEQHWLEELDARSLARDALIVDRFNSAWTLRERAALPPHVALLSADRLATELAEDKYSELILVERFHETDGVRETQVPANAALRERFTPKLLAERSFRENTLTKVYRLQPSAPSSFGDESPGQR